MASSLKKIKKTLGDATVDSTESIPELRDYFQSKNGKKKEAYSTYRRLMAPRPKGLNHPHFLYSGHPLNTFPEDWDGVLPPQYFEKFSYRSSLPCATTRLNNVDCKDPVVESMKKKQSWKYNCHIGLKAAQAGNYDALTFKLSPTVYQCPRHVLGLVDLIEKDPDPYFDDTYNWYYAGNGNLQVLSVNDVDCLLHSQLSRLYLSKFSRSKLKTKNDPITYFDCGEDTFILETICSANSVIALRLKHKVIILKLTPKDNSVEIIKEKEIESTIPFTAINFDTYQTHILYVTKLDGTLIIVNLEIMKCKTLKLMPDATLENNWNKAVNLDRLSYCQIARDCIKIYDKRNNNLVQQFSNISRHGEDVCDEISAVKALETSPYLRVATNHYLFLMDCRQNDKEPSLLRRWTHQMQGVPTYISTINSESNKELICLSSQWCEDTCLISNNTDIYRNISLNTSVTVPYRLPTFETMIDAARNKMLCVDIYNRLEPRLYTLLTGNAIVEAGDKFIVLTQNSLGDILAYTLFPEHLEVDDGDSCERLDQWIQTLKLEKKLFNISKVVNIADLWNNLKKVPKDFVVGDKKLMVNQDLKFKENIVFDICNSGKIDSALLDLWINTSNNKEESKMEEDLTINLHFSDSD